jgi:hypothetical protein
LSHNIGKVAFLKYVDSIRFEVDQTGHAPISSSLFIVGKTLVFTFNLEDVVNRGLGIEDWKERILELIGVLVPVSIFEVSEEKSRIEGQLASAFNKNLPINIPLE